MLFMLFRASVYLVSCYYYYNDDDADDLKGEFSVYQYKMQMTEYNYFDEFLNFHYRQEFNVKND